MDSVRKPAVASLFYPEDRINLKRTINQYLNEIPDEIDQFLKKNPVDHLFGIIVPHAGYFYSGHTAACAYSLLKNRVIDTVIVIGPSHRVYFEGFALSVSQAFRTPLGEVELDTAFIKQLEDEGRGLFEYGQAAHEPEHSLEVQLPFLQTAIEGEFKIIPVLMGEQSYRNAKDGAEIINALMDKNEHHYLVVLSTDLSHYHSSTVAEEMDKKTVKLIEEMNARKLLEDVKSGECEACGAGPLALFLELARIRNHHTIKSLLYQHSGNVSQDESRVVGYYAAAVW